MCDEALLGLRCHENGELVAVGNDIGTTYVVELSENFVRADKNDKMYLTAVSKKEKKRKEKKVKLLKRGNSFKRCLKEKIGEKKL